MLHFDRQGLIPSVIVDDATGNVLMVAFMNEEALQKTQETGFTHFFSRSRNTIWRKGEQSGNSQEVRDIFVNCEENSILVRVIQNGGAACHDGYQRNVSLIPKRYTRGAMSKSQHLRKKTNFI